MWLWLKVKSGGLGEFSYFHVVGFLFADRNGRMRNIRNAEHSLLEFRLDGSKLLVEILYFVTKLLHALDVLGSVQLLFFLDSNLLAFFVAGGFHNLNFFENFSLAVIKSRHLVGIINSATVSKSSFYFFEVFGYISYVQHGTPPIDEYLL